MLIKLSYKAMLIKKMEQRQDRLMLQFGEHRLPIWRLMYTLGRRPGERRKPKTMALATTVAWEGIARRRARIRESENRITFIRGHANRRRAVPPDLSQWSAHKKNAARTILRIAHD